MYEQLFVFEVSEVKVLLSALYYDGILEYYYRCVCLYYAESSPEAEVAPRSSS